MRREGEEEKKGLVPKGKKKGREGEGAAGGGGEGGGSKIAFSDTRRCGSRGLSWFQLFLFIAFLVGGIVLLVLAGQNEDDGKGEFPVLWLLYGNYEDKANVSVGSILAAGLFIRAGFLAIDLVLWALGVERRSYIFRRLRRSFSIGAADAFMVFALFQIVGTYEQPELILLALLGFVIPLLLVTSQIAAFAAKISKMVNQEKKVQVGNGPGDVEASSVGINAALAITVIVLMLTALAFQCVIVGFLLKRYYLIDDMDGSPANSHVHTAVVFYSIWQLILTMVVFAQVILYVGDYMHWIVRVFLFPVRLFGVCAAKIIDDGFSLEAFLTFWDFVKWMIIVWLIYQGSITEFTTRPLPSN